MRKKIFLFLKRIDNKLRKGVKYMLLPGESKMTVHKKNVEQWYKDEGYETRRFEYPLNSNSLVFDLGGYEGQWASDLYSRYNCKIFIFEPYIPFAQKIEKRFTENENIKVFEFGLGSKTETVGFTNLGDSSSTLREGTHNEKIQIVSLTEFIRSNSINKVDLLKINIEGGEYELLEFILDNGISTVFQNIQVQFHDFVENAKERMTGIQKRLMKTHKITYQYEFVWENWVLIDEK